jgi:hypothetical protein
MAHTEAVPVKYVRRTYIAECALTMGLYILVILARPWLIAHAANHDLALAVTVAPAVPIWLMLLIVWRYYLRIDEYEQKKLLEALAIAFGIGSCLVMTYSFLADAGFSELAILWAGPTLAVCWALTTAIMHITRR